MGVSESLLRSIQSDQHTLPNLFFRAASGWLESVNVGDSVTADADTGRCPVLWLGVGSNQP